MILRSQNVVTPAGVGPADVVVESGAVVDVRRPSGACDEDFGKLVLMPGLVDVHVHINEPGRTHWEGFETATKAAIAGGTTTLVDMPLNSIPCTTNVNAFHAKLEAARGKLHCDVGFWGGVVPGNAGDLEALWNEGVLGFKAFLVPSGVDEFGWVGEEVLREAAPILAALGAPLLAHCEVPEPIEAAAAVWEEGDPRSHSTWLASRPADAETRAIELLASLADIAPDLRLHVVHLATERGLPVLREAWTRGALISAETCMHYLTFDGDEVPLGATEYKCAPPLRSAATREALWDALLADELSFITTDHSPSPPSLKARDSGRFDEAWGGIASVQLLLSALYTEVFDRGHSLEQLTQWVSMAPARFAGLWKKGRIEVGADADLVVFDPDASWRVRGEQLQHRHKLTPYEGRTLLGKVERTYLRGECVYDGEFGAPVGKPLLRESQ